MAASKSQHHSQTFSSATIRQGIGTQSTGVAAAISGATDANATTSSPPAMSAQHADGKYDKKNSYFSSSGATAETNDITDNSCLTSPNKLIMPAVQKSPSESLSSKTDTDGKKCGNGKGRNKEGKIKYSRRIWRILYKNEKTKMN